MIKKLLALIPARIGSKRLKKKNLKILGNKELVSWSIDFAKNSNLFEKIYVSTDSKKIRNIAIKKNCLCPHLRPKKLSSSKANLVEVALHTLKYLKSCGCEFDGIVLLQPTSPFRSIKTLKKILKKFNKNKMLNPVISILELKKNPYGSVITKNNYLKPLMKNHGLNKQSQSLTKVYAPNGSIYVNSPNNLKKYKSWFSKKTEYVQSLNEYENLDIDFISDFKFAQYIVRNEKIFKNK